jgi:hypothetical protein
VGASVRVVYTLGVREVLQRPKADLRRKIVRYFRLLLVVAALSLSVFASDSPFSGTWKLKPKEGEAISSTAHVEADNEHLKLEQDFVDEKGKSSTLGLTQSLMVRIIPPSVMTVSIQYPSIESMSANLL